jgi:hypothetical protein
MNIIKTYDVVFEPFAERHFIKTFARKYKGAWNATLSFLVEEFKFFDALSGKSIALTIADSKDIKMCKTEFKISGTPQSRHGSGNRCIVAIHKNTNKVCVLLVYGKTDLSGHNETLEWKRLIAENYPEYKELCK